MKKNFCESCQYFNEVKVPDVEMNYSENNPGMVYKHIIRINRQCWRYPKQETVVEGYSCGEHEPKQVNRDGDHD